MPATFNFSPTLRFLEELSENNQKTWFDANRPAYQAARATFEDFINHLIDELRSSDELLGLSAKECIARIHRDIRFTNDKSPYHTNFSANIAPGGRKSARLGYYVSIGARGQSLIAGGLYMPEPQQLARFRQAVTRDAGELKRLMREPAFLEQFGRLSGERLKTAPKGVDRNHPEIELLQLKQVTVMHPLAESAILAPDFPAQALATCRAMKPFLDYLNELLR